MKSVAHTNIIDYRSFFWTPDYIEMSAWIEHIPFAYWLVEVLEPATFVELGVFRGTSYFAFCQAVKILNIHTSCYGVDTWTGDEHAGFYGDDIFNKVMAHNTVAYPRFSTLIRSTFDEAAGYFANGSIDLLHIDGFHTYEAVKHDFDTWLPRLSGKAIVVFHDINVRERGFGVFRFWEELKQQYRTFQFDFGYGLGVLAIGEVPRHELAALFRNNTNEPYYIFLRNLFSERGAMFKGQLEHAILLANEKSKLNALQATHAQLAASNVDLREKNQTLNERNDELTKQLPGLSIANEKTLKLTEILQSMNNQLLEKYIKTVEELNHKIQNQQQIIQWYKATYEERSLLGTIKQKLGSGGRRNTIRKTRLYLKPMNDISVKGDSNEYAVEGIDPFFSVILENKQLSAGWYYLSIEIDVKKDKLIAPKLYYNYGRGFNEQDVWKLPNINDGSIKSLVYFPYTITDLRFDPTTTKALFTIKGFRLKRLNKFQALKIGISAYKNRYFPGTSYVSFWWQILTTSLKTGHFDLRRKVQHLIYNIESAKDTQDYKRWIELYDTITASDFNAIQSQAESLPYKPLFSVVMPVYNAPIPYFKKAIESVIDQAYPNWELCIADDRSPNPEISKVLKEYQAKDSRIKVVFRETNGHISNASNSALELATGDYVALLDQDDELRPHSLYMMAKAINDNKDLGLIYSDEDKIDEKDNRFDPYFKTDWNPDLFYGQNMISHLGVYKLSLIKKIGGFRVGYEGSQDHDLALRCIEHLRPDQIHHIPHILYHWRAIKGSTAVAVSNKNYAYEAGIKALKDHLQRIGQKGNVLENANNSYRVKWELPEQKPLASIIIPTKDKIDMLATCVESILTKTDYEHYEVLIIDNNSEEAETYAYFEEVQKSNKQVKVLSYKNEFNFSAIVNYGVEQSKGEVVVLLNNDTQVINEEWLYELVSQSCRKEIGAVGAKLYYETGQIQHAGVYLYEGHPGLHIYLKREQHDPGYFNKLNLTQNYSAVTAACLAVRKEVYKEVGGFDAENLKVAYNDVDFCLKLRELGYRNLFTPFAQLFHFESQSRGNDMDLEHYPRFKQEHSFMLKKWAKVVTRDPYFNPNLNPLCADDPSIDKGIAQLAFPPCLKYEWQHEESVHE